MTEERVKRKISAILSADVAGYSRLMGEDEVSTVRTLEAYRKVMSDLIEQFRGRVVDSPGDNLLSEFSSVVDAVQCAVEIHEVIRAKNEELPEDRRMLFRIGVNLGDVIEEGDRIYGDGVNIAARLEGLAEAGGICISGSAHEQIENKLALGYEYLGEHTVKNIAKPVKVYRVPMGPKAVTSKEEDEKRTKLKTWQWTALGAAGAIIVIIGALAIWNSYLRGPSIEPASIEKMAYPLPDKPSIAVLPFTNMSGDPEQDYIGDGLSENIISALSVSSQIFVIASNSTFTYKGKPVKVQQVAEDLGVQYVLEGSILKSGDRLRVTAQLIDALSGHHLWSEVYDRKMKELFELLDEITKKIMVSLQVELTSLGEDARLFAKFTENLEAWKHFMKGKELYEHYTNEDNAKAREHFETALELDPQYVSAMSHLGWTHWLDFVMGWSDSPSASENRAFELAQKAVELDDQDPLAHGLLGYVFLYQRQHEKAIFEGTRAISLSPNFALGYGLLGYMMSYCGQFGEAITMLKKGYRLNPNLDPSFLYNLSGSYIFLERYEKALETCNEMEEHVLNGRLGELKFFPPLYSSWVYQELGREEEARAYMAEALKRKPDLSLEWLKEVSPYKNPAHLQRMLDAFRKAGMPEKAPGAVQEKPSIAVLPFDDLSPEKDQEYFVLGLSEEILNSLAQIQDLTVIAKTSSFSFRGKDKKIQEIGNDLGVDHIMEGSVRKAGNAIRITAQLIKAVDGSHLWSKSYDRELKVKEIFAVQENIATSVADELKVTLGIDNSLRLLGGTENVKAYELFLVAKVQMRDMFAKGQMNQGTSAMLNGVLKSLDAAIALDPEFAGAWMNKAYCHWLRLILMPADRVASEIDSSLNAALRAIELEPDLGEGYFSLGLSRLVRGDFIEAELAYRKGMELAYDPINPFDYGFDLHSIAVGNFKRANEIVEAAQQIDPLNQSIRGRYISSFGFLGDTQRSEEEYDHGRALFGDDWFWGDFWLTLTRLGSKGVVSRDKITSPNPIHDAAKEHLESSKEGLAELHQLFSDDSPLSENEITNVSVWAAYFGDPEFAMDAMEKGTRINATGLFKIWLPVMHEVRQLPRFKEFAKEIGLVDYWKKFGWPDLCRPVGDDDFECD
jgi:adenylate cyclase